MLKVRIIPSLLLRGSGLVKGVGFDSWRRVGTLLPAVRVYNARDVDELILLDIAATAEGNPPAFLEVEDVSADCRVPLTFGGGIRSIDDVQRALELGADKVSINTAAFDNLKLVTEAAARFGTQCVVASVDTRFDPERGEYFCHSHAGQKPRNREVRSWVKALEEAGAGEILICAIERDGAMTGYDIELIRQVSSTVRVPVIASGGCGSFEDMYRALAEGGASAVSAASIFHFTEMTPRQAKKYLAEKGVAVRL